MPEKSVCFYCLEPILPKRAEASSFCSAKCEKEAYYDEANFNGLRRSAVGFHERKCWVCGKPGLGRINVHHVFGRNIPGFDAAGNPETFDIDIYVVLCQGCHQLVYQLSKRLLLEDPKKVACLIALARHEKLLPNAKITVLVKEV